MVKINVNVPFVHNGKHYFAGEVRMVSEQDAAHFCAAGWATAESYDTGAMAPADVTLDVHNGHHYSTDNLTGANHG